MICKERVKKAEIIREIICELSDTEKIVYLSMYFDEYNYYDLLPLIGHAEMNYCNISD